MPDTKLFHPLLLGPARLTHRIAMAPLARFRAGADHTPTPLMAAYYAQRCAAPGTLLVAEASLVSPRGGGQAFGPGLWDAAHVAGWKRVVDAVHARGCVIFAQLFVLGRAAEGSSSGGVADADELVSSSAVAMGEGGSVPRALREEEVWAFVEDWVEAARGAVEGAGFDGVEIHGANGYLIDQFTQDTCNRRTDGWGGSVENRARFAIEVAKAVAGAVGPERTAMRLSPWRTFQGMRMADPVPQFTYLIKELRRLDLAYVHLFQSRIPGDDDDAKENSERLDLMVQAWGKGKPVLIAGGLETDSARHLLDEEYPDYDVVAVFGRYFLSTPDLVYRIQNGIPANPYHRETFYGDGKRVPELGYVDYPFSDEYLAEQADLQSGVKWESSL